VRNLTSLSSFPRSAERAYGLDGRLAVPFFSVSILSGYSPHGPDFGVYAFTLHTRARPSERLGKALRLHRPRAVARHARRRLPIEASSSSHTHPPRSIAVAASSAPLPGVQTGKKASEQCPLAR